MRLRIVERMASQGSPVPARVHLADAEGKPVLAPGLLDTYVHKSLDDLEERLRPHREARRFFER